MLRLRLQIYSVCELYERKVLGDRGLDGKTETGRPAECWQGTH